jgi:putative ABC transport system permease protein
VRGLPFEYAVRNLGRSWPRLLMSVGGSALVVVLVLAAAGFVRGMGMSLNVSGSPHNVIVLGAGSEESAERSEIEAATPSVMEASLWGIRQRAGVGYVSPQVHVMLPTRTESQQESGRQAMIRGITPEALLVHESVRVMQGRLPRRGANEVMLGRMAATALGAREEDLAVGKGLMIDGQRWEIVGRFSAPGTVFEGEAWTALPDIMEATKRTTISCVIVTLEPGEAEFADVAAFAMMRPDLELVALPEREYYGGLASFFGPIRIVAWVTAGLIGVGGLFGGLNTMYAAFVSRVRELGTLQALGFRRGAIVLSLVQESMLATAAGALIACAAGVLALDGLAVRFSMGAFGLVIDAGVIGVGLLAGVLLGLLGALPPAVRCLRLPIPVALKAV